MKNKVYLQKKVFNLYNLYNVYNKKEDELL
jgi:hypothetical protein